MTDFAWYVFGFASCFFFIAGMNMVLRRRKAPKPTELEDSEK